MEENQGVINDAIGNDALPTKPTAWSKIKNFLFYQIKVELTPAQQEFEDKMNEVLYKDVTFKGISDFFCQEISFSKKK